MVEFPRFEYFKHKNQLGEKWYWHLRANNHTIVALGGEPFNSKTDVQQAIRTVVRIFPAATQMVDLTK
jgi:uncharacterized protein YegP (UPF0339 family)